MPAQRQKRPRVPIPSTARPGGVRIPAPAVDHNSGAGGSVRSAVGSSVPSSVLSVVAPSNTVGRTAAARVTLATIRLRDLTFPAELVCEDQALFRLLVTRCLVEARKFGPCKSYMAVALSVGLKSDTATKSATSSARQLYIRHKEVVHVRVEYVLNVERENAKRRKANAQQ